jgi:hypothetical protein
MEFILLELGSICIDAILWFTDCSTYIRQGKKRIAPQNQLKRGQKTVDRQLFRILLFQYLVLALTTTNNYFL